MGLVLPFNDCVTLSYLFNFSEILLFSKMALIISVLAISQSCFEKKKSIESQFVSYNMLYRFEVLLTGLKAWCKATEIQ